LPSAAAKKNAPRQNMIWQQTYRSGRLRSVIIAIFAEHSTLIPSRTIILGLNNRAPLRNRIRQEN
jgi:hypothetical protein